MKKHFSTPDEVHLELSPSLAIAVQFVEGQLKKHEFKFDPPYQIKRHGAALVELMRNSGWLLSIKPDTDWEITPLK